MAKALMYRGDFRSRKNIAYRVEIYVEGYSGAQPYPLTFAGEEPVVIKWDDAPKEQPVIGSELTINLISTADREFVHLYRIEPGSVYVRLLKQEEDMPDDFFPYWEGLMDTEFYEEPYNAETNYPVSFTFTDFGILDRVPYAGTGRKSVMQLLREAAEIMQNAGNFDSEKYILKKYIQKSEQEYTTDDALENVYINSENFYDEDGEPMTWREVIDAVLQPLGAKITQKGGELRIFDLDGLYIKARTIPIVWAADDQQLGVDDVYNNVRLTFSTYSNNEPQREAELSGGTTGLTKKGDCTFPVGSQDRYAYFNYYEGAASKLSPTPSITNNSTNSMYYIESHGSGDESAGVRCTTFLYQVLPEMDWKYNGHRPHRGYSSNKSAFDTPNYTTNRTLAETSTAFTTAPVHINTCSSMNAKLRLTLPMLIDMRPNPFEEADELNGKTDYENIKTRTAICLVPVRISLDGDDGKHYHYHQNYGVFARSKSVTGAPAFGFWCEDDSIDEQHGIMGDGTISWSYNTGNGGRATCSCWLAYYSTDDAANNPAIGGWKTNRHNAGLSFNGLKDDNKEEYIYGKSLTNRDDGEFLPPPPVSGTIKITVYNTFFCYSADDLKKVKSPSGDPASPDLGRVPATWNASGSPSWFYYGYYDRIRWHLFKTPTLKWVRADDLSELDCDDVETTGTITTAAKEELGIDLKCGTLDKENPTSQACFILDDGRQIAKSANTWFIYSGYFARNLDPQSGSTNISIGTAEQLLINSLFSQYATRHQTLSGTIETGFDEYDILTYRDLTKSVPGRDPSPMGRIYMEIARTENVGNDEAEVTLCELTPSEYTPIT